MRILYFSRDYTTHDYRFLAKLATPPFEMHFLRLEADGIPYESRPLPEGVRVVEWEGGREPARTPGDWRRLMPAFGRVLERVKPDLIHAGPVPSCGFMAATSGFHPLLLMSWGSDLLVDADRDDSWRRMTRYALSRSDMLVCDSSTVRLKAQSLLPYPDDRVVQFPWGIDLATFRPGIGGQSIRERTGWDGNRIVLSMRTWEKMYGIDVLLESFRVAHESAPDLRLLMPGTGSLRETVEGFIVNHGLQDVVHCPGQVSHSELVHYFQAADIYMSCAHSDGTSISMLEALGVGVPVIATDIPSNREWIEPGINGWLGKAGDPESFASALLSASRISEEERAAMRQRNRALAEEKADWDRNIGKLMAAYTRLVQPGSVRSDAG